MKINIADLKKKIIYRANYRGTKEMDILLSTFVNKIIENLNEEKLIELLEFLKNDDDTLYKLNQKISIPNNLKSNDIFKMFVDHKP